MDIRLFFNSSNNKQNRNKQNDNNNSKTNKSNETNELNELGLYYEDNIVSEDLEKSTLKWFESKEANEHWFQITQSNKNARKVMHFGYKYNYRTGAPSKYKDASDLPDILQPYLELIQQIKLTNNEEFNQCIVNRYLPGQGIGFHIDHLDYGSNIICFSIGSAAEMEFVNNKHNNTDENNTNNNNLIKRYIKRRSVYVMSKKIRYEYKHSMRARKSDTINNRKIPRGIRYSITFRQI